MQQATADQLFRVLGQMRAGAQKFGQALSILEAGLPAGTVGPYLAALQRLQDAAPPMPASVVLRLLAESGLASDLSEVDFSSPRSASLGQVHRALWSDGTPVAVKVQYPGVDSALRSDLRRVVTLSRLLSPMLPGVDVRALALELTEKMVDELDYLAEARNQALFAEAFPLVPGTDVGVPRVLAATNRVLVTEWVEGVPLNALGDASQGVRNLAALRLGEFLFGSANSTGLVHGDPHPGNFLLTSEGTLVALDFGAVRPLAAGLPADLGRLLAAVRVGDGNAALAVLTDLGILPPGSSLSEGDVLDVLASAADATGVRPFRFDRDWLRGHVHALISPSSPRARLAREFTVPQELSMLQRTVVAYVGVCCQLEASVDVVGLGEVVAPVC